MVSVSLTLSNMPCQHAVEVDFHFFLPVAATVQLTKAAIRSITRLRSAGATESGLGTGEMQAICRAEVKVVLSMTST